MSHFDFTSGENIFLTVINYASLALKIKRDEKKNDYDSQVVKLKPEWMAAGFTEICIKERLREEESILDERINLLDRKVR